VGATSLHAGCGRVLQVSARQLLHAALSDAVAMLLRNGQHRLIGFMGMLQ
jgi:hypothetical protein